MKKIFLLLLATSLTANAWWWWRARAEPGEGPARASARPAPAKARATAVAPSVPAVVIRSLVALDRADLAAVRDALRAAGVDESSVRGLIEGVLRQRHKAQVTAWRIDRWRTAWWRGGLNAPDGPKVPTWREIGGELKDQLLGRDPLDVADAEVRYDFLPEEKRRKLAAIDLDYSELRSRAPASRGGLGATKGEQDELRLLNAERRQDVLATLTEAERAEYELRFSATAAQNGRRFAAIAVTEQEFRAIQPLIVAMRDENTESARGQGDAAARVEVEQRTIDRLVAAVGYDRTLDYLWGMDSGPYASAVRVLREANLPANHAARLLQLAAETGEQAVAIHYDATLTAEQKRAALVALQAAVRPRLDALVPAPSQPKLDELAIGWFTALGEGRYARRQPTLFGSSYMGGSTMAVSAPPVGPRPMSALARARGK